MKAVKAALRTFTLIETKMLPHQAPLYKAFDALTADDLKSAEAHIDAFFAALETDPIAISYRSQTFDRQVFEPDFIGLFTKEEIDAWCVLAAIKMQRRDWQAARDETYKQIELIDQHYGFTTPSWERPESRIPRDEELANRYFRVASNLATIMSELGDHDMSERWAKISNASIADRMNPDEVWGRWVAEGTDDSEPLGLHPYAYPDWSLTKMDVDGASSLVNLFSNLPANASPYKFNTLMKVCLPTDATYDVPSKSERWRIWSLRQAIASRFQKHNVGILFGELQRKGERVILLYALNENEARRTAQPVLDAAAAELSPRLEFQRDDNWKEYSKLGGQSVVTAPLTVQAPTADQQENENDAFLREVWKQSQSLTAGWSKMYALLWVVSLVPPKSATMHKYCIDYFFELLNSLTAQEKESALWHMVWKLSSFDPAAAEQALDLTQPDTIPNQNQGTANLAAESLANSRPERALKIIDILKNEGYYLIHKAIGHIAVSLAPIEIGRGKNVIGVTKDYISGLEQQAFSKATFLAELAEIICESYPKEAHQLLLEAHNFMTLVEERNTRAQVYMSLLEAAKKAAPELLPDFCPGAIDACFELMAPSDDWMNFGGPFIAINHLSWIVPYVVLYSKPMAVEILTQATDMIAELESEEVLDLLPSLAEAACALDTNTNQEIANRLWSILESNSQLTRSPGHSFLNNQKSAITPTPAEAFVKMNDTVAAQRIASIFEICNLSPLPEHQSDLLSTFAASMSGHPELASRLIAQATEACPNCSSQHLRARAFAKVAAAMHTLGLNSDDVCAEALKNIDGIEKSEGRLEAILDAAAENGDKYPEFAHQLLEKAVPIIEEVNDLIWIERIHGLPRIQASKLFFSLLSKRTNDRKLTEYLSTLARSFADDQRVHSGK